MEYPVPDPLEVERIFTDSIPVSYVIWKDDSGNVYADAQDPDLTSYKGTSAKTVVNNALADIPNIGGTYHPPGAIKFKSGRYDISGIDWNRGLTQISAVPEWKYTVPPIIGEGKFKTILWLPDGTEDDMIRLNNEGAGSATVMGPTVKDLMIYGNKANTIAGDGIRIDASKDSGNINYSRIENVYVYKMPDYGINFVPTCAGINVLSSRVERCGMDGLVSGIGSEGFISNSKFFANGRYGISLDGNLRQIHDCYARENIDKGILLQASRSLIADCTTYKNSQDGAGNWSEIRITGDLCGAVGNVIDGQGFGRFGIRMSGNDIEAYANTIRNVTDAPYYRGGTRNLIDGVGLNAGDPSATGDWNGYGREGIVVYDTSVARPYTKYQYVDGAWQSA